MRHRLGSILLGIAVAVGGVASTACHSGPGGGSRAYGSAQAPQARTAYVAPAQRPMAQPAYAAPAPEPVAYAAPSRSGSTAYLFLATWCGYCQKLERTTLPNAQVQAELASLNWRRINPDSAEGKLMAARYGVGGFPTTLILDGNGQVVTKIVGFQDPSTYVASLRAAHR